MRAIHKDSPQRNLLPEDSHPCVWMTAGQVAYKLCDRDFRCEECPLDAALRGQPLARPDTAEAKLPEAPAQEFPEDRLYGPGHTWAGVLDDGHVRIGLDAFAACLLQHASGVILPAPGSTIEQGRKAFWITDGSFTIALRSPVGGTVIRRNPRLGDHPALAAESPYSEGWLVELECADVDSAVAPLEGASGARERARIDRATLREAALQTHLGNPGDGIGPTLQDGGPPASDLRTVLEPARYYGLVCRILG